MMKLNNAVPGPRIRLILAHSEEEYRMVYDLRRRVFGEEQGYCEENIQLPMNKDEFYILALNRNKPVATLTFQIGYAPGDIEFERYFDLSEYYRKYNALLFCSRNAVIKEYRSSGITIALYMYIYKLCCHEYIPYVVIDCKKDNIISNNLFPRLGFAMIGECIKGTIGDVNVWGVRRDAFFPRSDPQKKKLFEAAIKNIELPPFDGSAKRKAIPLRKRD